MAADVQIVRSLPCLGCGYDLRGLMLEGKCPECGEGAAQSLHHLSLVDERELRQLRRAATMLSAASIGAPVQYIAMLIVFAVLPWSFSSRFEDEIKFAALAVLAIWPVACAIGWIRLLWRSSVVAMTDRYAGVFIGSDMVPPDERGAGVARVLVVVYAFFAVVGIVLGGASPSWLRRNDDAIPLLLSIMTSVWCARNFFSMAAMRWLALRAGNRRLARSVGSWRWLNAGCAVAIVVVGIGLSLRSARILRLERHYWVEVAATIFMVCVIASVAASALANFGLGLSLRTAIGRALRLRRASSEPFFTPIAPVDPALPLTEPMPSATITP